MVKPVSTASRRDEQTASTDSPSYPTIARSSIGLQASKAIKQMILSGELRPGDALPSERELAVLLGISRPSLREAIRALSAMNVLEARHGGGTYVTSLNPSLLAEPINFLLQVHPNTFLHLFEVRLVLEVEAARIAATKITQQQIIELKLLAEAAGRTLDEPDEYSSFDFQLHSKIVGATANPIYESLYASIAQLSMESRRRTARIPAVRRRAHEDHVALVDALSRRDPEEAATAMRRHLEEVATLTAKHGGFDALEADRHGEPRP